MWSPGEYLVIDWAEAAPGLLLFCAVLAFSRWRFVRFATDQRASTTMAMIAEALAAIGGVPAQVLADRMGCLKGGVVANVVVPTAEYVRFASHYGFRPDFCHANDPAIEGHRGAPVRLLAVRPARAVLTEARSPGSRLSVSGGQHGRRGVVRGGQRRGALGDLRSPRRTARWTERELLATAALAAARRSGRPRSPARSTGSPVSGMARPATRYPPG